MSNALHDYAKLFERYAANNGGTGAVLAGEDCLALANEMRMDADAIDAENTELRELCADMHKALFSLNLDHCQACPREDACVFMHKSFDCDECAFERDMRELGIEWEP